MKPSTTDQQGRHDDQREKIAAEPDLEREPGASPDAQASAKRERKIELETVGAKCPPSVWFRTKSATSDVPRHHDFWKIPSASHGNEATLHKKVDQLAPW